MPISFKSLCSSLIPVADYKALVTDMKFAAGGSKNILVTFSIVEGPYAKRVHTETISEKAYSFRLMPLLKACKVDINREFATAEELYKFGFAAAKNKTIMVSMGVRTYNGQEYNTINSFAPIADSTVSVDDVAKSFGEEPTVKGDAASLEGFVVEENNFNTEPQSPVQEPELDINLDDIDSPF